MTNLHEPDDDGRVLAAEIALGLVPSKEREAALRRHPLLASEIAHWEDKFVQLADEVTPVEPSAKAWHALRDAVRASEELNATPPKAWPSRLIDSLLLWRSLAGVGFASAALLAIVSLTRVFEVPVPPVTPTPTALFVTALLPKEGRPAYVATYDPSRAKIILVSAVTQSTTSLRPYLWLVPKDDEDPIRLGLADPDGIVVIAISSAHARLITASSGLVITLEPNDAPIDNGAQGEVLAHGVFKVF